MVYSLHLFTLSCCMVLNYSNATWSNLNKLGLIILHLPPKNSTYNMLLDYGSCTVELKFILIALLFS